LGAFACLPVLAQFLVPTLFEVTAEKLSFHDGQSQIAVRKTVD